MLRSLCHQVPCVVIKYHNAARHEQCPGLAGIAKDCGRFMTTINVNDIEPVGALHDELRQRGMRWRLELPHALWCGLLARLQRCCNVGIEALLYTIAAVCVRIQAPSLPNYWPCVSLCACGLTALCEQCCNGDQRA